MYGRCAGVDVGGVIVFCCVGLLHGCVAYWVVLSLLCCVAVC